jgi:hypothetical protein
LEGCCHKEEEVLQGEQYLRVGKSGDLEACLVRNRSHSVRADSQSIKTINYIKLTPLNMLILKAKLRQESNLQVLINLANSNLG